MSAVPSPRTIVLGNPPSPHHQPDPLLLVQWMEYLETTVGLGGTAYFENTLSDLQAVSSPDEGAVGFVLDDGSDSGVYRYDGSSWSKTADLPKGFAADILPPGVSIQQQEEIDRLWTEASQTRDISRLPSIPIGDRDLVPSALSFDLHVERGYWSDTGLPWLPGGEYSSLFTEAKIEVDGTEVIVTEWSFDLRPLRGFIAATGTAWPHEDIALPEMEVVFGSDQIDVYIRQRGQTYIQWSISHDTVSERNADIWRVSRISEAERDAGGYDEVQEIAFNGETEVAILFNQDDGTTKKPDHIGGKIHGNEELSDFYVLIDGVEIDHTVAGSHSCDRFEMIQASDMFEPGDTEETVWDPKGDKIMECFKRWTFTRDTGLRLAQRVDHVIDGFVVDNAYFGMLCLGWGTRGYDSVHTGAREPYWTREDVSTEGFTEITNSAGHIRAWGDRYSGEVQMTRGWQAAGRNVRIDNRPDRRKIYPDFFEGDITDDATPWEVETILNVTMKEGT